MPRLSVLLALSISTGCAFGQVFEVAGGNSSLYQAGGGHVSLHSANYDFSAGAGTLSGHIQAGGQLVRRFPSSTVTIGDNQIDFSLPTDLFNVSHYLFARGVTVTQDKKGGQIVAFAGETTTLYETPLFSGAEQGHPGTFFSWQRNLTSNIKLFTDTVYSGKATQIDAVQWTPMHKLELAGSAGIGAGKPYAAASINFSRPWLDLQASYVDASKDFHRVAVTSPLLAEPDKGNLLATLKPARWISFTGGIQNYLIPIYPTDENIESSVRQAGTDVNLLGFRLTSNLFASSYEGQSNRAGSFTLSRELLPHIQAMSSYLISRPRGSSATSSFLTTLQEQINAHLSVNETVDSSAGHTSVLFGGTLVTNTLSVSANYETFYVPAKNADPFQESLVLDISFHLFGRLQLHGATFVSPTGHLLYSADANEITAYGQSQSAGEQNVSLDSSILCGKVIEQGDRPVEGAALLIDERLIFTNSEGEYFLRERKSRQHTLKVETDQFLAPGDWAIVSAPPTIQSSRDSECRPLTIVVQRVPGNVSDSRAAPGVDHAS